MALSGIILAGGQSKRMGQDKGLLEFQGKPLIAYSIEALTPLCDEVLVIANDDAYQELGLPVYPDHFPNKGPLGGICTGLTHASHERCLVMSCDTPFVSTDLLTYLNQESKKAAIAICTESNRVQPLVAVYSKAEGPALRSHLDAGQLSLIKVLESTEHLKVPIYSDLPFYRPNLFFNINRPEDLREAKRIKQPDA